MKEKKNYYLNEKEKKEVDDKKEEENKEKVNNKNKINVGKYLNQKRNSSMSHDMLRKFLNNEC